MEEPSLADLMRLPPQEAERLMAQKVEATIRLDQKVASFGQTPGAWTSYDTLSWLIVVSLTCLWVLAVKGLWKEVKVVKCEKCDKCHRTTDYFYWLDGRRLCEACKQSVSLALRQQRRRGWGWFVARFLGSN